MHGGVLAAPGRQPLVPAVPEVEGGRRARGGPALAADAVREVRVRPADGHVQDEVELLVKGRLLRPRLPRVLQGRVLAPTTLGPEAVGVELDVQDRGPVDGRPQVVLRPLEAEGVEVRREVAAWQLYVLCVRVYLSS